MAKDSSLDDFLGGSEESAKEDDEPTTDGPKPALETADWSPEGAECEGCGATVQRRWRQGERMVCSACKEW